MIESIIYESLEEWEADYKAEVVARAQELNASFDWWGEAVCLFDRVGREDFLTGSSNLHMKIVDSAGVTVPQNIPVPDEMLLRLHNLKNVVNVLTQLSREHEFTWELIKPSGLIGERHLGYIERGGRSEALDKFVQEVALTYGLDLKKIDGDVAMREMIERHQHKFEPTESEPEDREPPLPREDPIREEWADPKT